MSGLDGLLLGNAEAIESLSIEERVKIPGGLPYELSIEDIAKLAAPNNQEKQELLIKMIVGLCKSGVLTPYGDINGWSHYENTPNPFPKVKTHYAMIIWCDGRDKLYAYSHDCLIHRDNFKAYLQSKKQWPVSGLLANWWHLLDNDAQKAIISKWSLTERAEKGYLDEYLSLKEICDLLYSVLPWPRRSEYSTRKAYSADKEAYNDAKNSNSLFLAQLISACKNGLLAYEGDINAKIWQKSFYIPDSAPSGRYICNAEICTVNKEQFKNYLLKQAKWPVSGLLANWWSDEQLQAEALANGDDALEPVKRLIKKGRNRTELLDLIYQMFDAFDMKQGDKIDKLTARAAWGHIIAKKYKNDLIKTITGERKAVTIELNGGDQVDFDTFSRTYNRRFK